MGPHAGANGEARSWPDERVGPESWWGHIFSANGRAAPEARPIPAREGQALFPALSFLDEIYYCTDLRPEDEDFMRTNIRVISLFFLETQKEEEDEHYCDVVAFWFFMIGVGPLSFVWLFFLMHLMTKMRKISSQLWKLWES